MVRPTRHGVESAYWAALCGRFLSSGLPSRQTSPAAIRYAATSILMVPLRSQPSTLGCILRQLCPRCRSGRIFPSTVYWGFPKMSDRCLICGLHFNREPGYFLGAMYISYGLAVGVIVAFGVILWLLTRWSLNKVA